MAFRVELLGRKRSKKKNLTFLKASDKVLYMNKLHMYSEDGARIYEVTNENGKIIDSLYIGYDDYNYGDQDEIDEKIKELIRKYGPIKITKR